MFVLYDRSKNKVPIKIWLNDKKDVEESCLAQAEIVSQHPAIFHHGNELAEYHNHAPQKRKQMTKTKKKKLEEFVTIVVLNDGVTFTDIAGCTIQTITASDYYRVVEAGGDARDFTATTVIHLGIE